jgi:hypothetical protein
MKSSLFLCLLLACMAALTGNSHAGRLHIAVIHFNELKTQEELAAAFAGVDLGQVANGDRIQSSDSALGSGQVRFAQSMTINPGSSFNTSTRTGSSRSDVEGQLSASTVEVTITLHEGSEGMPLSRYTRSAYNGSGSISGGVPRLISFANRAAKTVTAIKSIAKTVNITTTSVVVAQYVP